jgi:hypothetical protein
VQRAWRRILRRYRGLFRALAMALALHVSGVGHVLADAIECGDHEDPDCCEDGDDCPPGCPDCHCSRATTPDVLDPLGEYYEHATVIEFAPADDGRASPSFCLGVYRPPRA